MNKCTIVTVLAAIWLLPVGVHAEAASGAYKTAYQEALAAHEKAVSHNNQWTTTIDALDAAEKAAQKGNYEKAIGLAHEADRLAGLAVQQAKNQEEVWKRLVPR